MKRTLVSVSFLLFCLYACNDAGKETNNTSENDLDAARNFLQASLKGDYEKAKAYMLQDSINLQRMDAIERMRLSDAERKGLSEASINIHEVINKVKDSVTVCVYSNSFKKNWDTLRVINQNGKWLVDLNYLFAHDSDTLTNNMISKPDTLLK